MYRGTPSRRYHSQRYEDRSYDAIANTRQNSFRNFTSRGYGTDTNRFERSDRFSRHATQHADTHPPRADESRSFRQQPNRNRPTPRDTIDATATFSSTIVDPVPAAQSLINRLQDYQEFSSVPDMKHTTKLPKHLAGSFGGSEDDWYVHVNKLELDVFQKHAFNGMQCYFALKGSLKGETGEMMYDLETGMDTPKWRDYIPSWYEPTTEDWRALAENTPFVQFRYAFRVALVYRYFHYLYQEGDPEAVYDKFRKAIQGQQQSVKDWWVVSLKKRANEVKRYRPEIPFNRFAEQLLVGTKSASFVIQFRQVFRPINSMLAPTVRSYQEFDVWFAAWKTQQREIARQKERQKTLRARRPKNLPARTQVAPNHLRRWATKTHVVTPIPALAALLAKGSTNSKHVYSKRMALNLDYHILGYSARRPELRDICLRLFATIAISLDTTPPNVLSQRTNETRYSRPICLA